MRNFSDIFYYDESSVSCLKWKENRYGGKGRLTAKQGADAGGLTTTGYYTVSVDGRRTFCHRIIMSFFNENFLDSGLQVDHIDGDRKNNKIDNLRAVTRKINSRNMKMRSDNKSGVAGVHANAQGWEGMYKHSSGIVYRKFFSENKYGKEAFKMAVDWRKKMLEGDKEYTERHGK